MTASVRRVLSSMYAHLIFWAEEHYWKLWGLGDSETAGQGMSSLKADATFDSPEITIKEEDVQQFCKGL